MGVSEGSMVVALSSDGRGSSSAKGLYALGILSHEASIIAAKESAEMKTIEFFTIKKIVVDGAGHSITKRRES
jgi:tRNA(Met) C34 N-acetyltransferase TmcA